MGILVITWNFPPRRGGIEYLVSNLCDGLRKRHSVLVITAHAQIPHGETSVFRAPLPGLIAFALYVLWRGALVLIRNPGITVVLGGSAMVTPLVLILARLFGRKAVVQTHGLDLVYNSSLYQWLCARWIRYCDLIVANSTHTAGLAETKGILRERISIIPPGVHPERFAAPVNIEEVKRTFGLSGKKLILFVGRLAKRKGVKEFIENSFVTIVRELPNVCFVIVGDNPTESLTHRDDVRAGIRAAVARLGLEQQVRLLGLLSDRDMVNLYRACDIFLLPVLAATDDVEGFGIVSLEAAAAGKPVVATRVGGIPDAIEDGKSGILVEAGDYDALRQATVDLLNDEKKRLMMGAQARQRLSEHFTWEKILPLYETVLER